MNRFFIILPILLILIQIHESKAQFNLNSYQLQETLPQANVINPGFVPDSKVVVGLPGISGIYASGSLPVSFSSFVNRRVDDSLQVDLDKLVNGLGKKNNFSMNAQAALLYVGVRINKGYLSINARSLNDVSFMFPKELVELAVYGNGADNILGRTQDLSALGARGYSLISTGVGYAHTFLEGRLTVGLRVSYIKGIATLETEKKSEISIGTNDMNYAISLAGKDLTANVSGEDLFSGDISSPVTYILSAQNNGFGLDFGANMRLSDKLSINGAITDIGHITWKTDVVNYNVEDGAYTYEGFDLEEMDNVGDAVLDTLEAIFDPNETENSFGTSLFTKFYAGVNYELGTMHNFGAVMQGVVFKGRLMPALSFSYGIKLGRGLNARISYSAIDGDFTNLGFGFTANAGFLQLYAISDNVLGIIYPQNTRYTNARIGINLTFGRKSISR